MRDTMYLSVCGKYGNEKSMLSGNKCEQRLFFFFKLRFVNTKQKWLL